MITNVEPGVQMYKYKMCIKIYRELQLACKFLLKNFINWFDLTGPEQWTEPTTFLPEGEQTNMKSSFI